MKNTFSEQTSLLEVSTCVEALYIQDFEEVSYTILLSTDTFPSSVGFLIFSSS